MLTTVFASVGLPIEAIGAFLVIDRFLDMFRTMTNISGDIFVIKIIDNMDNNKI
jgi:Na+/H+-dicarboxylate symporter